MGNLLSVKLLKVRERDRWLRGGVFVGKGGFGCTYSPPLLSDDPTMIGKVIEGTQNAEDEHHGYETMELADLAGHYTVPPTDFVELQMNARELHSTAGGRFEVEKCGLLYNRLYKDSKTPLWQITMPKADGDVFSLLKPYESQPCDPRRLLLNMKCLRNLYRGLVKIHEATVCHLDVKDLNAVVFGTVDNPFQYKYIDFGLSQTFKELSEHRSDQGLHQLSRNYQAYPYLANVLWTPLENNWVDYFAAEYKEELNKFIERRQERENRLKVTRASLEQDLRNLDAVYGCRNAEQRRIAVARATDVYGLAQVTITVFQLLARIGFVENDYSATFKFGSRTPEDLAVHSLIPVAALLAKLLSDMMHMRIGDGQELVRRYDEVLSLILQVITEQQVGGQIAAAAQSIRLKHKAITEGAEQQIKRRKLEIPKTPQTISASRTISESIK